jgi:ATP-dependent DNA ligase
VDGELVALGPDGRCDLALLRRRHGLTDPWRIGHARRWCPLRYELFDLLYHRGRCLLHEALARRRQALAGAWAELRVPGVLFSAGVVGAGQAFYAEALARGQEGVIAKHLAAPYRPGRRWAAWRKIKPPQA